MIYQTQNRKQKIEWYETHYKPRINSGDFNEGQTLFASENQTPLKTRINFQFVILCQRSMEPHSIIIMWFFFKVTYKTFLMLEF